MFLCCRPSFEQVNLWCENVLFHLEHGMALPRELQGDAVQFWLHKRGKESGKASSKRAGKGEEGAASEGMERKGSKKKHGRRKSNLGVISEADKNGHSAGNDDSGFRDSAGDGTDIGDGVPDTEDTECGCSEPSGSDGIDSSVSVEDEDHSTGSPGFLDCSIDNVTNSSVFVNGNIGADGMKIDASCTTVNGVDPVSNDEQNGHNITWESSGNGLAQKL